MKVEIKKTEMERKEGHYKVILSKSGIKTVAQLKDKKWYIPGYEFSLDERDFSEIDEIPVFTKEPDEPKSDFKPFELSLIIESREELQELWHRTNLQWSAFPDNDISGYIFNVYRTNIKNPIAFDIWQKVDEMMEQFNIKP